MKRRLAMTPLSLRALRKQAKQSPTRQEMASRPKTAVAMTESRSMKERQYCVYIMTNTYNTVLYPGVTNN